MVTIKLNETSAEDAKAIMELKKLGISDEQIQEWYDKQQERKEGD